MTAPDSAARGPWRLFAWSLVAAPGAATVMACGLVAVVACELAIPWLLAQIVDGALVSHSAARIDRLGLVLVATIGLLYVTHVGYLRAETVLLYRALQRLRQRFYSRVLDQPPEFFASAKTGELVHLVMNDTEVLENHGVQVFSDLPFSMLATVSIVALMFFLDWRMAAAVVGFLTLATALSFRLGRPLPTLRRSIQKAGAQLTARLTEALSGIKTVRALGLTTHEVGRLDAASAEVTGHQIAEGLLGGWIDPLLELLELLGLALVVWYGAHRVLAGAMTPGTLVAFIAYMEFLSEPVSRAGRYVRHVQVCRGVMQRLTGFLAALAPERPAGTQTPAGAREVAFENVNYTYPGEPHCAVKNVSLRAKPGEIVAIVGRNGAGKSTLLELLLGFRSPQCGRILVADCPVEDWASDAWHRSVAVMSQEVFLFHATLAENIRCGRLDATPEQIEEAAMAAGLAPLIRRLSLGMNCVLGDRGQRLSGGERQRVAWARVLVRNPDIIVLDEPTAALDGEAANHLAQQVSRCARSRTVFIVAHHAQTVALAERVVILDEGRIVFDGTHAEATVHPLFVRLFARRELHAPKRVSVAA